ncbi:MAG TPA: hypothetical protein VF395_19825, partial [Polyangiaceae bacterium]
TTTGGGAYVTTRGGASSYGGSGAAARRVDHLGSAESTQGSPAGGDAWDAEGVTDAGVAADCVTAGAGGCAGGCAERCAELCVEG